MKISLYQTNAQMLRETQRVLHQQHLQTLHKMNCQENYRKKVENIKAQWIKANSVDVYA